MTTDRIESVMFGISFGFVVAHLLKPLLYPDLARDLI